MAELNVGALFATVELSTVAFDRGYAVVQAKMRALGAQFEGTAKQSVSLDEGLTSVGTSADKAGGGLTTAERAAAKLAATEAKATQNAERQAVAQERVATVMGETAAASAKVQQAALREAAAKERLTAASAETGSAEARQASETARLATTQAGAIGSTERLAAAQRATVVASRESAVASRGAAGGFAGMAKTAGELGIVVGAFAAIKAGIDITKEANEFQRSMVQVQTNADVTASEVHKASGALLSMAGPVAAAPEELAVAWYHAKSVGLDYAKSINTTRIAAEGARVGHADLEETMNALTSTVASGIPGVKNMSGAMGQLIATVGSGDMKLSDLNDALSTGILTVVKGYGLSLTDVGAAVATFGDNNIRGAAAATMLRMAVQSMAVPAVQGRDKLHDLGLTTTQLAKDMQKGGLNKAVLDLKAHLKAAGVTSKETGAVLTEVFGKRAGPGIAVLVGQTARLESKFKVLRSTGASFADKWKATTQTASFALASLGHSAEAAGIKFTTALGPAIATVAHGFTSTLTGAISTVGDVLAPFSGLWTAAKVAMGAVGTAIGAVGHLLGTLRPELVQVGQVALGAWAAFAGVSRIRIGLLLLSDGLVAAKARAIAFGASMRAVAAGQRALTFGQMAGGMAAFAVAAYAVGKGLNAVIEKGNTTAHLIDNLSNVQKDYKSALDATNGALTTSVQKMIGSQLQSTGLADKARAAGISLKQLTAATTGNNQAFGKLAQRWKEQGHASDDTLVAFKILHGQYLMSQQDAKRLGDSTNHATAASKRQAAQIGTTSGALLTAQAAGKQNAAQVAQQTLQYQLANDAASLFAQTLNGLAGIPLSVAQAQTSLASANLGVADSFKTNGKAIDGGTKAAVANQQAIQGQVSAAQQYAEALGKQKDSSLAAVAAFKRSKSALEEQLQAQGKLTPAVQAYIDKLYNVKNLKVPPTKLDADTLAGLAKIKSYQTKIDNIRQGKVPGVTANTFDGQHRIAQLQADINNARQQRVPGVTVDTSAAQQKLQLLQASLAALGTGNYNYSAAKDYNAHQAGIGANATGGSVPEGLSVVGEGGAGARPEMLIKHGSNVQVVSHPDSLPIAAELKSRGMKVPGFAGGTSGNFAAIARLLRSEGATNPGIAGWLGNTDVESGGRTTAHNPGENAWGWQQWEGSRLGVLQRIAGGLHVGITSQAAQLAMIKYELHHGYGSTLNMLRHATSARDAAAFVDANYERSSGDARGAREAAAERFMSQLGAGGLSGGSAPAGGSGESIRHVGKDYIVGDTRYASLRAAENAVARSGSSSEKAAAEKRATQAKSARTAISDINKVGSTASGRVSIVNGKAVNHAASTSDVRGQLYDAEGALRQAGVPRAFVAGLAGENQRILRLVGLRNHAGTKLLQANTLLLAAEKKLHDDTAAFKGGITGSVDITTLGQNSDGHVTAGSALAASHQAVSRAKAFVSVMHKLIGLKVFPNRYLRTLLGEGPSALPEAQALASMNPGQLKSLAADNAELYSLGAKLGGEGAVRLDQPAVQSARADQQQAQKWEQERQQQTNAALKEFGDKVDHALNSLHVTGELKLVSKGGGLYALVEASKNTSRARGHISQTKRTAAKAGSTFS